MAVEVAGLAIVAVEVLEKPALAAPALFVLSMVRSTALPVNSLAPILLRLQRKIIVF
jgi:hypothetical protein